MAGPLVVPGPRNAQRDLVTGEPPVSRVPASSSVVHNQLFGHAQFDRTQFNNPTPHYVNYQDRQSRDK